MIEAKHLSKQFGSKTAVDDIAFTVAKGEILGFLGPNGAGKSTTMRMLTGYLPPSQGTAVIGGCDLLDDPIGARRKIGYLPENAPVYPDMNVFDFLNFVAEIRGFTAAERKLKVPQTIEKCFLSKVTRQTVSTLSKGFKQRVCFAQSILHDPEYLILDEPTDGLDPNQKHEVRLMIREMSTQKAIILSTHILEEVESVCTRAIIIDDGRIVADDSPENLMASSPDHGAISLTVKYDDPGAPLASIQASEGVKSAVFLKSENGHLFFRAFPERGDRPIADKIVARLSQQHYAITSLFVEKGRLDEVFRRITGHCGPPNAPPDATR
jgi:ABC-2 type transport system ATP-binding protein